ncbi:MAG: hypothetical protein M5R40_21215 [Anaerolineae bacterium]|nr:hypothetical protein [Anaerolineae bacterium]
MARETNVTPASTPSPTPATAQTNLWVTAALIWHGVLGVGLLIFGVLTLFGVMDVFGVIQLPQYGSFLIQFVVFLVTAALGGVQLVNLRGLQAHWSRARMVSVGINFAGFVLLLFITFRQLTCTNVCAADMFPFAPDRMALWVPFFIITVAFGGDDLRHVASGCRRAVRRNREAAGGAQRLRVHLALPADRQHLHAGPAHLRLQPELHRLWRPEPLRRPACRLRGDGQLQQGADRPRSS